MSIRDSKFIQHPIVKKPLLLLYGYFWYVLQHTIKNDKLYLSIIYWLRFRKAIRWNNPQTFNEKLNWLKVHYHRDILTQMADKYEAKKIVAKKIGPQYVVPLYGVWDQAEEIDFVKLPNQFVLKCNHNSGGGMCICKDKSELDYNSVRERLERGLKKDFYLLSREWPYKNIHHRILAEQLLVDNSGAEINDYKWWCFNGEPMYMYRTIKSKNRHDVFENFYDMDFNPVMIDHGYPRRVPEFEKPAEFEEMKQLAKQLSDGLPFVRMDFFDVNGKVYFGEFTFYDWGGMNPFKGDWDAKLGSLLTLPTK